MSIKNKLSILTASLVAISILILGIITYSLTSKSLTQVSTGDMKELSKSLNMAMETVIDKEKASIAKLSEVQSFKELLLMTNEKNSNAYADLLKKNNGILKSHNDVQGNLEHAFLVNTKGEILSDSDEKLVGASIADRDYNKKAIEGNGKQVISETLISKSTGAPIVCFTAPIMENGKLIGYVASAVKGETFNAYLKDVKIANSLQAMLIL